MINIRRNVFETNSSSSHSISISSRDNLFSNLSQDEDGIITLNGGQFGWSGGDFFDAETKANYCAVDSYNNPEEREMLRRVIKEHTGCKDVVFNINFEYDCGDVSYIDHQSHGTSQEAFESEATLKRFLFNPESYITIDNDNHYDYE